MMTEVGVGLLCSCTCRNQQVAAHGVHRSSSRQSAAASKSLQQNMPACVGETSMTDAGHHLASAGVGLSWHLSRVVVYNEATDETAVFDCNAWFDAASGDGAVERVFYVSSMPSLVSILSASLCVLLQGICTLAGLQLP